MRILVTGGNGQLGQALQKALADHMVQPLGQSELDIASIDTIERIVGLHPDLVIHTAAFTNVDACAREPDRALLVNGLGTKHVALACRQIDAPLIYISTNEVFDGRAQRPYLEFDSTAPINSYGYSKWAGEQVVQQLLRDFWIVRISWVYGGERNFVRTILRLAQTQPDLRVVDDEVGCPSYAPDIAHAIAMLIRRSDYGIYHLVNEGYCSRYEFAREILARAGYDVPIVPIRLAEFKRDSTPPAFGALRNFVGAQAGITLRPWRDALAEYLADLQVQPS